MSSDLVPLEAEWKQMMSVATVLVKSGVLPNSVKTPETAMAIMLKGRELGIPPMRAFAQISIIAGKPALGAELMLARVYERYPNADIHIIKRDADGATIEARRNAKREYQQFSFLTEDAKRADVLGKDSWRKYPRAMYFWRAVSDMVRSVWPECLAGASHTPEELGAEVDENGEPSAPESLPAKAEVVIDHDTTPPEKDNEVPEVRGEPKTFATSRPSGFDLADQSHMDRLEKLLERDFPDVPKDDYLKIAKGMHGRPMTKKEVGAISIGVLAENTFAAN